MREMNLFGTASKSPEITDSHYQEEWVRTLFRIRSLNSERMVVHDRIEASTLLAIIEVILFFGSFGSEPYY